MKYDDNNIFAKILRGEIPCNKIYEDEYVLSFYDVNPQKKIHALIIPKGKYIDLDDFNSNASNDEIVGLMKGITTVSKKLGIHRLMVKAIELLPILVIMVAKKYHTYIFIYLVVKKLEKWFRDNQS